jgi:hypothetical protein
MLLDAPAPAGATPDPDDEIDPDAAPAGASPTTAASWLMVVLPLLGLVALPFVDWDATLAPLSQAALHAPVFALANAIAAGAGAIAWVATALLAYADQRALAARGIPRPFHWAWGLVPTPIVYLVGRSVTLSRRGAADWSPLVAAVAIAALLSALWIAVTCIAFSSLLGTLPHIL